MDKDELYEFAMSIDRKLFLSEEYKPCSGVNAPLPIGFGQTISQPSLVWEMTRHLDPNPNSRVLEIGTGSGYQTLLLSHFSKEVYTVERIPQLSETAEKRLKALGCKNIHFHVGDGSTGWKEHAPFDHIMVTAAAKTIPPELIAQLAPNGRMVIPVGLEIIQELLLVQKDEEGEVEIGLIEMVRFVELKGRYGWS